jgi:ATP-binding cassette, subfamily B, bacterial
MTKYQFKNFQKNPRSFIFFIIKQKFFLCVLIVFFIVLARSIYAMIPVILKMITDIMTDFQGDYRSLYFYITLLLISLIGSMFIYRASGLIAARWIPYVEVYAARISFDYLIQHSAQYFANRLSGKLQSKIFNISTAIHAIFPIIFWNFIELFVKLSISIFLAFTVHVIIGIIFLFFVGISITYSFFVSKRLSRYSQERAEAVSETRGVMVDVISNILAVKQNVAIERESFGVRNVLEVYRKRHVRNWIFFEKTLLLNNFIILTMFGMVLYVSIYFFGEGFVSAGDIIMLLIIMMGLYGELQFLSMSFNRFMEQYGQLREGLEEIFISYDIVDDVDPMKSQCVAKKGGIVFDNVTFHYEEEDAKAIFKNLTLRIPPGEKVGIVGESGAGKSTFVNLLLRFVEPESGMILIDDHDIAQMRQNDLRRAIAYVPQEALLFHRSLRDNIKYSNPDSTDEEMFSAVDRAHAKQFIEELPSGYDTLVGERGVKLSGGQKQRIMIARAMIKKSPILILDEATSSLDSESEKLIQAALDDLMHERTTIIIAHRLSTLKKMDRIIVFDKGKVIEDGTHTELIKKRGKYFELWQYQSGNM